MSNILTKIANGLDLNYYIYQNKKQKSSIIPKHYQLLYLMDRFRLSTIISR